MATAPNLLHLCARAGRSQVAVQSRNVGSPPSARKIHHVDGIALIHEVVGPARPAVRSLQQRHVGLTSSRLNKEDWIGMPDLLRHPNINVHRSEERRVGEEGGSR